MHSAAVFSHTAMELGFLLRFFASTHALAVVICTHGSFLISLVYLSGSLFHRQLCLPRNARWVHNLVAQSGYVLLSSLKWLQQRPPWLHLQLLKPITTLGLCK